MSKMKWLNLSLNLFSHHIIRNRPVLHKWGIYIIDRWREQLNLLWNDGLYIDSKGGLLENCEVIVLFSLAWLVHRDLMILSDKWNKFVGFSNPFNLPSNKIQQNVWKLLFYMRNKDYIKNIVSSNSMFCDIYILH